MDRETGSRMTAGRQGVASMTALERKALAYWREREMGFPLFDRRMRPDDFDHRERRNDAMRAVW